MKFDIVTIGTATIDVFLKSKNFRVIQDPSFATGQAECVGLGSKLEVEEMHLASGGGATNTATTFARFGLSTASIFNVGNDLLAPVILDDLKKENVFLDWVVANEGSSALSTILIAPGGERTILVYRGVSETLEEKEIKFSQIDAGWFYLAPLSGKNASLFEPLLNFAKDKNIKVALNPSKAQIELGQEKLKKLFETVSIVILNSEEASLLVGTNIEKEKELFGKMDEIVEGIVVVTLGPKGVLISDGKTFYRAGTFKEKEVVDRTGAGDAFGSGFVAGIMAGFSIEEAIRFASANSTSVVEHVGAKRGILKKEDFEEPRWQDFKVEKEALV